MSQYDRYNGPRQHNPNVRPGQDQQIPPIPNNFQVRQPMRLQPIYSPQFPVAIDNSGKIVPVPPRAGPTQWVPPVAAQPGERGKDTYDRSVAAFKTQKKEEQARVEAAKQPPKTRREKLRRKAKNIDDAIEPYGVTLLGVAKALITVGMLGAGAWGATHGGITSGLEAIGQRDWLGMIFNFGETVAAPAIGFYGIVRAFTSKISVDTSVQTEANSQSRAQLRRSQEAVNNLIIAQRKREAEFAAQMAAIRNSAQMRIAEIQANARLQAEQKDALIVAARNAAAATEARVRADHDAAISQAAKLGEVLGVNGNNGNGKNGKKGH